MRNVFVVFKYYLYSEPGDPLAAGLSEWAVSICTDGQVSEKYTAASIFIHFVSLFKLPGGTK